jgi:CHRD domain
MRPAILLCGVLMLAASVPGPSTARSALGPHFSAQLRSDLVVSRPQGVPEQARARFTGRLDVGSGCILGCTASYRLAFSNLSGPPVDVVIRFGRRGQVGSVWHRLCSYVIGRGNCPKRASGVVRGGFSVWRPRNFPREIYVEISTQQNPLGELRGQIELR